MRSLVAHIRHPVPQTGSLAGSLDTLCGAPITDIDFSWHERHRAANGHLTLSASDKGFTHHARPASFVACAECRAHARRIDAAAREIQERQRHREGGR